MTNLDNQVYKFQEELTSELGLSQIEAIRVCSTIATEISSLPSKIIKNFIHESVIPLSVRHEELKAFQGWMEISNNLKNPFVTRAQLITQNYVCFIYLKDSCFEFLARKMPKSTMTSKCCKFLVSGNVRKFRNGFAHGNWSYLPDFSGIEVWSLQDARIPNSSLVQTVVTQEQLNFWQTLARAVAYAIYETLLEQTDLKKNIPQS